MLYKLLVGDVLEQLATLPDNSVHCAVTSPPYWGLRDYGVAGQLGLERTPQEYVAAMVRVFSELRRVLRNDGQLWLNIGDSYNAQPAGNITPSGFSQRQPKRLGKLDQYNTRRKDTGLKPKDLCMIPARVALALQDDGWWLRSQIVWAKRAPMPESVTDRPTSAWESIFLLTKSARYFYDAEAVEEGQAESTRNQRNVWHLSPEPYSKAHFACVDESTEALTQDGWLRHDQLRPGMMIAAYSMESQRLRWQPIEDIARYTVQDEEMVRAQGTSLDMLLTPNHRCVVQRRVLKGGVGAPFIKRADQMTYADHTITAAAWDECGSGIEPEWAELLGWYVAEGHAMRNSMSVEIAQSLSANAPKVDRIRSLLNRVEADYREATATRDWRGKETTQTWFRINGYAAARLRELAPDKRLPSTVLTWDTASLQALLDGLIGGDGHLRKDGRMSFIQKNEGTADLVQAIAVRLGRSAVLSTRDGGMHTIYFTEHTRRSLRGTGGKGALLGREQYSGVVWCPKTPDGTWVARRNGRVFITGNTFPTEIPRRAILAGTSAHGCCASCGAPWKRVVEREVHTTGWQPTCTCFGYFETETIEAGTIGEREIRHYVPFDDAPAPVPATVLDPFAGSGTTLAVALSLGRRAIGIELNPEYAELAHRRITTTQPAMIGL